MSNYRKAFRNSIPGCRIGRCPLAPERCAARLERPYPDLVAFYDAIAPHAERAIAYLDGLDINDLSPQAVRLMHQLYSMILVSYAVNVCKQNRIPDSGAAFFDMVAEPAV